MSSLQRVCIPRCASKCWQVRCHCAPRPEAHRVLLARMHDCLDRILGYTQGERARVDASRLARDAVIRKLQTLAETSQRLSSETSCASCRIQAVHRVRRTLPTQPMYAA